MEAERIICGYPTLINWEKADCEIVTALIEVKVTPQRGQGFDKIAEQMAEFLLLYLILDFSWCNQHPFFLFFSTL